MSVTHARTGGPVQQDLQGASALIRAAAADYMRDQRHVSASIGVYPDSPEGLKVSIVPRKCAAKEII